MANISVHKDETRNAPLARGWERAWEPRGESFRLLRDLMSWDPFREMIPVGGPFVAGFVPSFEVKETRSGYVFKADMPGVKDADLDVTITGNRLTVSGKREAEAQEDVDTYYTYERTYGDFTRSFTLPDGIEASSLNADLKDGVLTLEVKKTPEMQPKKIPVHSSSREQAPKKS
ncbi:MAG: Hsp20/alpha crystallin family protein [Polyangiaceae bacterium]